ARSASDGRVNRAPAARTDALAREIRCPIVASLTPNAFAISPVPSPPTARNVSATADDGDNAGWQHMNSSARLSSAAGTVGGSTSNEGGVARNTADSRL